MRDRLQLAVLDFSSNEMLHLFEPLLLFNDVDSTKVCAWLCTDVEDRDEMLPPEINSWIFKEDQTSCTCTVIENEVCADEIGGSVTQKPNDLLFVQQIHVNVELKCIGATHGV